MSATTLSFASTSTAHVCDECGCRWCGLLPASAPTPPKCVGSDEDHKRHAFFWSVWRSGHEPSRELNQFADEFEARVNAHFDSLEPADASDWSVRKVEWS